MGLGGGPVEMLGALASFCGSLRNPFRSTFETMGTIICWCLQENHHSRVSWVVQDVVHPQFVSALVLYPFGWRVLPGREHILAKSFPVGLKGPFH